MGAKAESSVLLCQVGNVGLVTLPLPLVHPALQPEGLLPVHSISWAPSLSGFQLEIKGQEEVVFGLVPLA